jgi:hypothetical protein
MEAHRQSPEPDHLAMVDLLLAIHDPSACVDLFLSLAHSSNKVSHHLLMDGWMTHTICLLEGQSIVFPAGISFE